MTKQKTNFQSVFKLTDKVFQTCNNNELNLKKKKNARITRVENN